MNKPIVMMITLAVVSNCCCHIKILKSRPKKGQIKSAKRASRKLVDHLIRYRPAMISISVILTRSIIVANRAIVKKKGIRACLKKLRTGVAIFLVDC